MPPITKGPAPEPFLRWTQTPLDASGRLPAWEHLHGHRKRAVLAALLAEQGWVCCYCGAEIGVRRGDCHIEHFRPRSRFPTLRLAYENLLASCQGDLPPEPNHCGHRKRDWFDDDLTLDPLSPDSADALRFLEDGRVTASPNHPRARAAHETITRLNLNASALLRQRQAALDAALGLDLEPPLSPAELHTLRAAFSARDPDGHYAAFSDALSQCLQRLLPQSPPCSTPTPPRPTPPNDPNAPQTPTATGNTPGDDDPSAPPDDPNSPPGDGTGDGTGRAPNIHGRGGARGAHSGGAGSDSPPPPQAPAGDDAARGCAIRSLRR